MFEAKHKFSDQVCAVKKIDKTKLNPKEKLFLRNELQIISMIRHPYVVEIRDVYESKRWIFISMESVKGGELFNYLDQNELTEQDICKIIKQALEALGYLHSCGVVHRDIKPENILVELEEPMHESLKSQTLKCIKITDFGLSKIMTPKDQVVDCCGTPAYVAPEILLKVPYGPPVDVWALGVVFYLMIAKILPFQHADKKQTFKLIKKADPDFSLEKFSYMSKECVDLISMTL